MSYLIKEWTLGEEACISVRIVWGVVAYLRSRCLGCHLLVLWQDAGPSLFGHSPRDTQVMILGY